MNISSPYLNPEHSVSVEDPIKSSHDLKTTRQTIKQLLADGTPDWVSHPEDYRAFVQESFAAEKEISDLMASQYKMADQDILSDAKPRKVNVLTALDFLKKLKANGIQCLTFNNPQMPQTVGLWAKPKFTNEIKYISYLQLPCMYEWSVLRLNRHGVADGEDFRGWRTVLAQLILKEILTEEEAHRIFGQPSTGPVSSVYRRTLWNFRNGVGRKADGEVATL